MTSARPVFVPRPLPELLAAGLSVVFVGSAAGRVSALRRAYYAGPGNRFWPTLAQTGLTPRRFAPEEFPALLPLGIGLSDLNPQESGSDASLSRAADDPAGLSARLEAAGPRIVAFNGKRPAASALCVRGGALTYGPQAIRWAGAAVWVLPSSSGAASGFWDLSVWQALADAVRA